MNCLATFTEDSSSHESGHWFLCKYEEVDRVIEEQAKLGRVFRIAVPFGPGAAYNRLCDAASNVFLNLENLSAKNTSDDSPP